MYPAQQVELETKWFKAPLQMNRDTNKPFHFVNMLMHTVVNTDRVANNPAQWWRNETSLIPQE